MEYAQPKICSREEMHKFLRNLEIQMDHLISAKRPYINQQQKRACRIVQFAAAADYIIKSKENEKKG